MDMAEKLDFHKIIVRLWSHDLNPLEFAICIFIEDRTAGWNQDWCVVTLGEFMDGKPPYRGRIKAAKSTIRIAIDRLVRDGYLFRGRRKSSTSGYPYSLNKDRTIFEPGCKQEEGDVVDLPKRRRPKNIPECRQPALPRADSRHSGVPTAGTHITTTLSSNTKPQQSLRAAAPLSEAEAEARSKTDEAVSRKAAKVGTAGPLYVLWRSANLEAFPNSMVAPWPRSTAGEVKQFAAIADNPVALLDYAVANWTRIIREDFGWMTKKPPPKSPDIRFLMRFAGQFVEALNKHLNEMPAGRGETDPRERLRQLGVPEATIAKMKMKMPRRGS